MQFYNTGSRVIFVLGKKTQAYCPTAYSNLYIQACTYRYCRCRLLSLHSVVGWGGVWPPSGCGYVKERLVR